MNTKPKYKNERYQLYLGKSEKVLKGIPSNSVHSIVCDPPYELGFMGKKWDSSGIANSVELWTEALRVLKPGGYLLAFSGSRTYHRMVCAIEDAGFEVRDQIMWLYGSGFPKSQNVGKALDKAAGAERKVVGVGKRHGGGKDIKGWALHAASNKEADSHGAGLITVPSTDAAKEWDGWGTALKPAHEPICVARKPFKGTVANNVLANRTGALNIDACRVPSGGVKLGGGNNSATVSRKGKHEGWKRPWMENADAAAVSAERSKASTARSEALGRWPANIIHDGSPEVVGAFAVHGQKNGGHHPSARGKGNISTSGHAGQTELVERHADTGTAARFFYCAKASRKDRNEGLDDPGPIHKHGVTLRQMENAVRDGLATGNTHPTVKPTELMRYLVRLVTPPNGIVLDIFMGSGSTGKAAMLEGFKFAGIDMTPEYVEISRARIRAAKLEAASVPQKKTSKLFK